MQLYWQTLRTIFHSKGNRISFAVLFSVLFLLLRVMPHWTSLWQLAQIDGISFVRFMEVFWEKTILSLTFSTLASNIVAFALPALIALNVVLFIVYAKKQHVVRPDKSLLASLGGMFLGLFGVGCFACSGLLLAPLISAVGLTSVFARLPQGGQELAYIGLFFLALSDGYLIKKITQPSVCSRNIAKDHSMSH